MKLTQETRQAIEVLVAIARRKSGSVVPADDVAATCGLSREFASKILQRLRRAGILIGHRGAVRGYELARSPKAISVSDIALAIEVDPPFRRCIFWSQACSDRNPCVLHDTWKKLRPTLERELNELTLAQLAARRR